jgi:hypothetical protein
MLTNYSIYKMKLKNSLLGFLLPVLKKLFHKAGQIGLQEKSENYFALALLLLWLAVFLLHHYHYLNNYK